MATLFTATQYDEIMDAKRRAHRTAEGIKELLNHLFTVSRGPDFKNVANFYRTSAGFYSLNYINDFFITGGFIASLINHDSFGDIDVYFHEAKVARFWQCFFKDIEERKLPLPINTLNFGRFDLSKVIRIDKVSDYPVKGNIVLSEKAATLTAHDGMRIQFIFCMSGSPDVVTNKFDMVHCCGHYDYVPDKFGISPLIYHAIKHKKLYATPGRDCVDLARMKKYVERGYSSPGWSAHKYHYAGDEWSYMKGRALADADTHRHIGSLPTAEDGPKRPLHVVFTTKGHLKYVDFVFRKQYEPRKLAINDEYQLVYVKDWFFPEDATVVPDVPVLTNPLTLPEEEKPAPGAGTIPDWLEGFTKAISEKGPPLSLKGMGKLGPFSQKELT